MLNRPLRIGTVAGVKSLRLPDRAFNSILTHYCSHRVLTRGEDYVDPCQQHYEELQCERRVVALKRRATALGFVIASAAGTA